jgi:hypothetical protein
MIKPIQALEKAIKEAERTVLVEEGHQRLGRGVAPMTQHAALIKSTPIFLCAPFIKYKALEYLLNILGDSTPITIVTRWEVDEIIRGVSDVEIWDLIAGQPHSKIYLLPNLHAKYYRLYGKALQGSANLTSRGLGLLKNSNIELLLDCPPHFKIEEFEEDLLSQSTIVTQNIYEAFASLSKEFASEEETIDQEIFDWMDMTWPRISCPANLFKYYSTGDAEESEEIQSFLCRMKIDSNLDEVQFNKIVAVRLLSLKYYQEAIRFCEKSQRFGACRQWLRESAFLQENDDVTIAWQNTLAWIKHFLPDFIVYYGVPGRRSEVLQCKPL